MQAKFHSQWNNIKTGNAPAQNNGVHMTGSLLTCLAQTHENQAQLISQTYDVPVWFLEWADEVNSRLTKEQSDNFVEAVFDALPNIKDAYEFEVIKSRLATNRMNNLKVKSPKAQAVIDEAAEAHQDYIDALSFGLDIEDHETLISSGFSEVFVKAFAVNTKSESEKMAIMSVLNSCLSDDKSQAISAAFSVSKTLTGFFDGIAPIVLSLGEREAKYFTSAVKGVSQEAEQSELEEAIAAQFAGEDFEPLTGAINFKFVAEDGADLNKFMKDVFNIDTK